jgi:hypothetical protein
MIIGAQEVPIMITRIEVQEVPIMITSIERNEPHTIR